MGESTAQRSGSAAAFRSGHKDSLQDSAVGPCVLGEPMQGSLGRPPGPSRGWRSQARCEPSRCVGTWWTRCAWAAPSGPSNHSIVTLRAAAEVELLDCADQAEFLKESTNALPSPPPVQPLCPPHLGPQHLLSLDHGIRILVPISSLGPTQDMLQDKSARL